MRRRHRKLTDRHVVLAIIGIVAVLSMGAVAAYVAMWVQIEQDYVDRHTAMGLRAYLPSDQEMIDHFHAHRATLEAIVAEVESIPHDVRIAINYYWGDVSEQKLESVRHLLRLARVYAVSDYKGKVFIVYAAYGWIDVGWEKEFVWMRQPPPEYSVPSLDAFAADLENEGGEAWRQIDDRWYLYYADYD